jgi:hypothetical protein
VLVDFIASSTFGRAIAQQHDRLLAPSAERHPRRQRRSMMDNAELTIGTTARFPMHDGQPAPICSVLSCRMLGFSPSLRSPTSAAITFEADPFN